MAQKQDILGNASHLNGKQVANTAPANGQALCWNATDSQFEPATPAASSLAAVATVALALTGAQQDAVRAALVDGAITVASGSVFVTKVTAAALTLAAPTSGTDDGKIIRVFDATGHAHTITTPSNKVNGAAHLATFAGSIGDVIVFEAYQGVWYSDPTNTGVVIS